MAVNDRSSALRPNSSNKLSRLIVTEQDYQVCRQLMRAASKNYSFSVKFLPAEKIHHVEALYALLRVGDDRVDVSHEGFSSPQEAIEDWERAYWDTFETGSSPHPVMRAYHNTAVEFSIPPEVMDSYFRAMKEDLTITRFPTFADLLHYMDGSSIPVGRAMTYILGVHDSYTLAEVLPRADSLGIAMQLSNFWRDIGYDWDIGRVYIPQEDLAKFGVSEADLASGRVHKNFIHLMEFQFERTERYYDQAQEGVKMLAAGQWGVMSGLAIYRSILTSIRRNRYDVFNRRAGSSTLQKLGLVLGSWWWVR